ncbi:MAG TPA: type II toxin-antitoxin system VapC family toxin [Phytomonospora sp.]
MIVVDASVLSTALVDDGPAGQSLRARISGHDLAAPALIDLEVAAVVLKGIRRGLVTENRAALAIADLAAMPIDRVPHVGLLRRIWELNDNVTPYDAAYVAVAELYAAPLWTADAKLAKAPGPRCRINLITAP